MILFGQKKTSIESRMQLVDKIYQGNVTRSYIENEQRVSVNSAEEEMTEFLNFSEKLRVLKKDGLLVSDRDDKATWPNFTIYYPKEDRGYYYVILFWCENVVLSEIDKVT